MAAWKAETEQLFMRHSVAELRAIERKMRLVITVKVIIRSHVGWVKVKVVE
jgi:hypothetical protein